MTIVYEKVHKTHKRQIAFREGAWYARIVFDGTRPNTNWVRLKRRPSLHGYKRIPGTTIGPRTQ